MPRRRDFVGTLQAKGIGEGRVLYHVWLCGFYASNYGDACKGAITIWGSDGSGGFRYYRHWSRGSGC